MPVAWYIIPTADGPYSRANPCRPKHVTSIRCNWVGQALPLLNNVYICKVNTTDAKHTVLAAQTGVRPLPRRPLQTLIGDLPPGIQNQVETVLNWLDLPFYTDETIRRCLQRIVVSGLFGLPNVSRDTLLRDLPPAVRQRGGALLDKWSIPYSGDDTILEVLQRCRDIFWNPDALYVGEF